MNWARDIPEPEQYLPPPEPSEAELLEYAREVMLLCGSGVPFEHAFNMKATVRRAFMSAIISIDGAISE